MLQPFHCQDDKALSLTRSSTLQSALRKSGTEIRETTPLSAHSLKRRSPSSVALHLGVSAKRVQPTANKEQNPNGNFRL